MSSTRNSIRDKWLLVKWGDGGRGVVSLKSVISPISEAIVGTVVVADKGNGTHEAATIIECSRDRQQLENQIDEQPADPIEQDEPRDFSASGSSWAPSDDNASSDDEEADSKKPKIECFSQRSYARRSGKLLKPSHRVEAINAIIAKSRKRVFEKTKTKDKMANGTERKSLPDSTRENNSPAPEMRSDIVSINVYDIIEMKKLFQKLFKLLKEIKEPFLNDPPNVNNSVNNSVPLHDDNLENESLISDMSRSEDLNRSDDNVLITNKYESANNMKVLAEQDKNMKNKITKSPEWIPIGTGQTLIHKDHYRKVNWKSYTIATRTLLLAAFPRRVLATHCLTGKRSPAFQDKPAKMCLDPKIVSDILIEITDRFHVKENLVRSIITTKCADECKMYKTRLKRKTMSAKNKTINNVTVDENDLANKTC